MNARELLDWHRYLRGIGPSLSDAQAEACARLGTVLLCGEQSAVQIFAREVSRGLAPPETLRSLQIIEREEAAHEQALEALCRSLPAPPDAWALKRRAQRFFLRLGRAENIAQHFGQIAILDSAVCRMMYAIEHSSIARGTPMHRLAGIIKRDEARHVAVSRRYAALFDPPPACRIEAAAALGSELATMLAPLGDSFEVLGVCSDRLFRRLRRDAAP